MATADAALAVMRASRPRFRNLHDRVAFVVHATMLASGFRPIAMGRAAEVEAQSAAEQGEEEEVGIEGWNELSDSYAFRYVIDGGGNGGGNITSSTGKSKVVVKCLAMAGMLLVDAVNLAADGGDPAHLEIRITDYAVESDSSNFNQHYKNLPGLVKKMESSIVSKLHGSSSGTASRGASSRDRPRGAQTQGERNQEEPRGRDGPVPVPTVPPVSADPLRDDPLRDPLREPLCVGGGIYRPGFGEDLFPSGGAGILPGGPGRLGGGGILGPGGGFHGEGGFPGGMLVGPGDPRWGSFVEGGRGGGFPAGGRGGIPGRLPPGARFDPYGPSGVPGFEPDRFMGGGGRPPSSWRPPHPDLEHFQPPF